MDTPTMNIVEAYNGLIAIVDAQLKMCKEIREANDKLIHTLEDRIKKLDNNPTAPDLEETVPF